MQGKFAVRSPRRVTILFPETGETPFSKTCSTPKPRPRLVMPARPILKIPGAAVVPGSALQTPDLRPPSPAASFFDTPDAGLLTPMGWLSFGDPSSSGADMV